MKWRDQQQTIYEFCYDHFRIDTDASFTSIEDIRYLCNKIPGIRVPTGITFDTVIKDMLAWGWIELTPDKQWAIAKPRPINTLEQQASEQSQPKSREQPGSCEVDSYTTAHL